jgi:hypothetical protein
MVPPNGPVMEHGTLPSVFPFDILGKGGFVDLSHVWHSPKSTFLVLSFLQFYCKKVHLAPSK